jgi:Membrane proteins related to metalloendopeptidases
MVIVSNNFLTKEEMTVNANYILNYLTAKGWTKNSVCGMLGNMETESTINPGLWQNRDEWNTSLGFGLVQWTPATKYINWANSNNYEITNIDGQLTRLDYEIDNKIQWIATSSYPMSFQEFKTSTESPEYLAQAFLRNYERPANQNQPNRSTQARYWFDNLSGEGGCTSFPLYPTLENLVISSPYGWRINPVTGEEEHHHGIDIGGGGVNQPLFATQDSEVIFNGWTSFGGWTIRLKHLKDKYFSLYQHMENPSEFQVGALLLKGEELGKMGATGLVTGIHLHFEIATSTNGFYTQAGTIDPEKYFKMCDGGGTVDPPDPPEENKTNDMIALLLCDALNGWKW